jgi:hypothetical protein
MPEPARVSDSGTCKVKRFLTLLSIKVILRINNVTEAGALIVFALSMLQE